MKATTDTTTPKQYRVDKQLNLPQIDKDILAFWEANQIFEKSIETRQDAKPYVFYEGPPSVNGLPGIHHVMARTIKDLFCRYHTLKGKRVERKGGWDTHGLPIELAVEKKLGITKEAIGKTLSIEEYNQHCRTEAMKYIDIWNDLTRRIGYWVDMEDPYITYKNDYVETLWHLLKQLYDKGLLYKGYTIQPYSPAAGTGLSSHELNMPGAYQEVTDNSATAQFKLIKNEQSAFLFEQTDTDVYCLAWTTTPWTLPSNTALTVGKKITYNLVRTFNRYTHLPITVLLAKDLMHKYFKPENGELSLEGYEAGAKQIPYQVISECKGTDLLDIRYEQLLAYAQPEDGDAFRIIHGDFVTTEDGTGVVHTAPSFGADDMMVGKKNGIGSLTLVDKRGKFIDVVTDFAGRPVKNYDNVPAKEYRPVDVDIIIKLKKENKAFFAKKYNHNYPHCWRTDKPIIYYPLDSWFVRTTAFKERMVELNKTINWKPAHTGEGRFGNWLANLVDWNLSRSRFWGTPLPIWRTADGSEEKCIGSIEELQAEVTKAVEAGYMDAQLPADFDLHRPYVDNVFLVSSNGEKMTREPDLIDVWFDSGAMPYAQWHYPFENHEKFKDNFPADFIAEGVDQTRGWFFTLHAIATMLFDGVSFKNVVSNGLVLDDKGKKMSKRLGNAIDPFMAIDKYGVDANRWYMISASQPWDNLSFSLKGVDEVRRKFFGTLFNTYSFFALYANVDGFFYDEAEIPVAERPEIDRWIISLLNSLTKEVDQLYADYEPTRATRLIQSFVGDHLSNWYVRLCRRRFWKGEYNQDKIAAYQTLYTCMETITQLMSPVAPFFADYLFQRLNEATGNKNTSSVHLSYFPEIKETAIDKTLEERMQMAQDISSMVLSLRKKERIKVRQPLQKILIPVLNPETEQQIAAVKDLILSEVNVKEIEFVSDTSGIVSKSIKPDFKKLGRKLGRNMGKVKKLLEAFNQDDITQLEATGSTNLEVDGQNINILLDEVVISSEDIEGWLVNSMNGLTVALDINLTDSLKNEGLARELVKYLQGVRKDRNYYLTDRIQVSMEANVVFEPVLEQFKNYICAETLIDNLQIVSALDNAETVSIENKEVKIIVTLA